MIRHRPYPRIRSRFVVFIAGLVVVIGSPAEHGAGQTPPPPAPDPVPDTNPNQPPTSGSSGSDSSGSSSGSSGGDSSGSPSGSARAGSSPVADGTESSTSSPDGQSSEPKPEPRRQKQQADEPDRETTAIPEARDTRARPDGNALGLGVSAQPKASTPGHLGLIVLALAGTLALVLLLLAAVPPQVLAGVSVALAKRQRMMEIGVAAVLMSLVIGLLVAQCGAQLR